MQEVNVCGQFAEGDIIGLSFRMISYILIDVILSFGLGCSDAFVTPAGRHMKHVAFIMGALFYGRAYFKDYFGIVMKAHAAE